MDMSNSQAICDGSILFTNDTNGWNVDAAVVVPTVAALTGGSGSCQYMSNAPIGTYTITVTAPGYTRTQRTGVVLAGDGCGAVGQSLTIPLPPAAGDDGPAPSDDAGSGKADDAGNADNG
jgi:hypothetical protein